MSMNVATDENYTVAKIAKIALKALSEHLSNSLLFKSKPNGQMRKDT